MSIIYKVGQWWQRAKTYNSFKIILVIMLYNVLVSAEKI